jgi:hypothetical protein
MYTYINKYKNNKKRKRTKAKKGWKHGSSGKVPA